MDTVFHLSTSLKMAFKRHLRSTDNVRGVDSEKLVPYRQADTDSVVRSPNSPHFNRL
jgi:hypothetical protein